jgi:hypothetical protein
MALFPATSEREKVSFHQLRKPARPPRVDLHRYYGAKRARPIKLREAPTSTGQGAA